MRRDLLCLLFLVGCSSTTPATEPDGGPCGAVGDGCYGHNTTDLPCCAAFACELQKSATMGGNEGFCCTVAGGPCSAHDECCTRNCFEGWCKAQTSNYGRCAADEDCATGRCSGLGTATTHCINYESGEACRNGSDDDGDGLTDSADSDCGKPDAGPLGAEICNNSKDDNADHKVDCADPQCATDPYCTGTSTPDAGR
jgi:hypothetical protein